jgi:hypothetical protein
MSMELISPPKQEYQSPGIFGSTCTRCGVAKKDHYQHSNGKKYCVSIFLHLCLNLIHCKFTVTQKVLFPLLVYWCTVHYTSLLRDALHVCDMKLTFFCVSTTSGLLHDVFQLVSVHPHPHWNLLQVAQRRLPFCDRKLTLFCVSTTSGLVHDVFQSVSVDPHPHWNLLRIAQRRVPFVTWN